jgi:hypothetical protein
MFDGANTLKKTFLGLLSFVVFLAGSAVASTTTPDMPRTLANARFVYVTAYDGDQFDTNLLPEDRAAIAHVQDEIQKWGKLTLVYRPEDADIVLRVESRPSEDILAVYDAHSDSQTYLWRVMARGGLQKGEAPLVSQFERAWEKIAN